MNNPDALPVDAAEQREWLMAHKKATGLSWADLGQQSGIPAGTLSQFGPATYRGDNDRIAREIFRFRQHIATQGKLDGEAPEVPGYFETATSRRILALLSWAHRGRITVVATGPGTGKSMSAEHYAASVSNVWLTTMSPSSAGVNNMQIEVLAALGERDAQGTPQKLSRRICERVRDTRGLIAIDEAQHLSEKAVEEIRSWHDKTRIGIALLGNESVIARLEGGARKAAYAQLFSRVGMRHVQNLPHPDDARALAAAWGIEDDKLTASIVQKSQMPGGLRGVTMMLELASMIAAAEGSELSINHLTDAWTQLVSRPLAA